MWDMHHRVDTAVLPPGRTVLQFNYSDAPLEMSRWRLLTEDAAIDLFQSDPGLEVDLYAASTFCNEYLSKAIRNIYNRLSGIVTFPRAGGDDLDVHAVLMSVVHERKASTA